MVILIGGSSHVGKTLLAQKLLDRYHYPYVSLDHLKMGFIRSGMTELTVEDDVEMRYFMWPFVVGVIKTAVENGQSLILEGCYIPAEWKDSFDEEYLADIRSVFLVMSEDYLREHIDLVESNACVIENRICDEVVLERLIACSAGFKSDCITEGTPYIEIDGRFDIEELTKKAARICGLEVQKC